VIVEDQVLATICKRAKECKWPSQLTRFRSTGKFGKGPALLGIAKQPVKDRPQANVRFDSDHVCDLGIESLRLVQ